MNEKLIPTFRVMVAKRNKLPSIDKAKTRFDLSEPGWRYIPLVSGDLEERHLPLFAIPSNCS